MPTGRAPAPLTHDAFRQRQRSVELDGLSYKPLRVAWTDLGDGAPVILLHGIPTWSFLYNEVIPPLAETARVIAPDFLGHGYSDRRDFFDRSLLAQTAMIMRLMDHLGIERADFVGHDTGGGVALIMAINHPERVARLVLTNVVAYDSWPIDDMIALGNPNWRSKSPKEVADFLASGLAGRNLQQGPPDAGVQGRHRRAVQRRRRQDLDHPQCEQPQHQPYDHAGREAWRDRRADSVPVGRARPLADDPRRREAGARDSQRPPGARGECVALDPARHAGEICRGGEQLSRLAYERGLSRTPQALDGPLSAQHNILTMRGMRNRIVDPSAAKGLTLSPRQS